MPVKCIKAAIPRGKNKIMKWRDNESNNFIKILNEHSLIKKEAEKKNQQVDI